ncbi:MAG: hypothetical protein M1832_000916 [Thelocarpon impressellum]|nr:MAG: hypothetical protein M1832_000916 [Thelocarpon impressellum]
MADRSAESGTSDDDAAYKAVDLISDSDSDEPDVEEAEERNIIDEAASSAAGTAALPCSPPPSVASDWEGFEIPDPLFSAEGGDPYSQDNPYFADELELYNVANALDRDSPVPAPESKRVRFQDDVACSDSPSSVTTDGDEDVFPDLFMQQDLLDPQFRQMIENDQDNDDGGSGGSNASYWDLRGSDGSPANDPVALSDPMDLGNPLVLGDDANLGKTTPLWPNRATEGLDRSVLERQEDPESAQGSSSGYETDDGETTDEDLPPPQCIARTRSVLRRPSTSSLAPADDTDAGSFRKALQRSLPRRRLGPALGSWIADPCKPVAFVDSTGKRMVIYPALRPARKAQHVSSGPSSGSSTMNTSPQTPSARLADDGATPRYDFSHQLYSPSGANLSITSLLHRAHTHAFLHAGQILGPPEAFYPFRSVTTDGRLEEVEEFYEDDDDDDDEETMLNIKDFIDFGDTSSCEDNDGREDTSTPGSPGLCGPATASSPVQKSSAWPDGYSSSDATANNMLDHFDRGVVTSFRRNQARHKLLINRPARSPVPPGLSSFAAQSAIKGGRLAAANSPITPKRKRKNSAPGAISTGGFGPVAGFASPDGTIQGHKRRKSGLV